MSAAAVLRGADTRTVLRLSGTLAGTTQPHELRETLFELPRAVGADWLLDARMERQRDGQLQMAADVSDPTLDRATIGEVVVRWWRHHPVIASHVRRPTAATVMVSDFLTAAQWRRNVVFNEGYRPMGVAHDLSIQLEWAPGRTGCAALHRGGAPFSERDRAMLQALAPHVRAAHERIAAHADLRERVALLQAGIESTGQSVVFVAPDGRVLAAGASAQLQLREWFGASGSGRRLPGELADWHALARRQERPSPLLRVRAGSRLRVTVVAGREQDVLVLREDADRAPTTDELRAALPISRREAEVLALLARGLANAEIARELGLSTRTVGHHIEHLFAKLGTPNRAAAAALAQAAVQGLA